MMLVRRCLIHHVDLGAACVCGCPHVVFDRNQARRICGTYKHELEVWDTVRGLKVCEVRRKYGTEISTDPYPVAWEPWAQRLWDAFEKALCGMNQHGASRRKSRYTHVVRSIRRPSEYFFDAYHVNLTSRTEVEEAEA